MLVAWLDYLDAWCQLSPSLGRHLVNGQHDSTRWDLTGRMYDRDAETFLDVDVCRQCAHGLASVAQSFVAEDHRALFAFTASAPSDWNLGSV